MTNKFIEIPATKQSFSNRKPIYGIGINDANYITQPIIAGKKLTCPFYRKWTDMLKRCYSDKFKIEYPTYNDCLVCDEWLMFSNFKSWMQRQEWQGKELDKDIIIPRNKIYSPETCAFITSYLNGLLNDRAAERGKYPQGVSFNKRLGKFQSKVGDKCKQIHIGFYQTSKEASDVYIKSKVNIILKEAEKHEDNRVSSGLRLHGELLLKS